MTTGSPGGRAPGADMDLFLALDVGTTLAKALHFDARGRVVDSPAFVRVPVGLDGTADAQEWIAALEELVDRAAASPLPPPAAVGVSCAWHSLVGIDADTRPLTELTTWEDTRAADEAEELRRLLADPEATRQRTGAPIHPSLPPARLLRHARTDPHAFRRVVRWCAGGDLLGVRWCDSQAPLSPSLASATGLRDATTARWDDELLSLLRLSPERLGPVGGDPLLLNNPYSRRWPRLAGIPWFPALGDGAAALLGSGCTSPERAAVTVGTSAAVRVLVPLPQALARPLPPALFRFLLDGERAVVGASRSNAGNLLAWAERTLRLPEGQDPLEAALARPPGAHGLTAVPALSGERSPDWPLRAHGALEGLRLPTTAVDILQALVESAVLGLAVCVDVLEDWGGTPLRLIGSAGVTRSPAWARLIADATGRSVTVCSIEEASARGAALFARARAHPGDTAASENTDGHVVGPDEQRARAFARRRTAARLARP